MMNLLHQYFAGHMKIQLESDLSQKRMKSETLSNLDYHFGGSSETTSGRGALLYLYVYINTFRIPSTTKQREVFMVAHKCEQYYDDLQTR